MRPSKQRSRSKANRSRPLGNIVNRVFDSSGPEGKVRGTPQQIIDKYQALARDAHLSNDRVAAENFLQHSEHYTRMLGDAQREMTREAEARREQHEAQAQARQRSQTPQPPAGEQGDQGGRPRSDAADGGASRGGGVQAGTDQGSWGGAVIEPRGTDPDTADDAGSLVATPEDAGQRPPAPEAEADVGSGGGDGSVAQPAAEAADQPRAARGTGRKPQRRRTGGGSGSAAQETPPAGADPAPHAPAAGDTPAAPRRRPGRPRSKPEQPQTAEDGGDLPQRRSGSGAATG